MQTGIIYRAFNKVSEKSYIGQTTRTLEIRKQQHLYTTIKADYKFGRALQKYKPEDWEWIILAEVLVEELDEYERFFINDLNTFKQGYNTLDGGSWKGDGCPHRCNPVIYELWHPEYGEVKGTQPELFEKFGINNIYSLLLGKKDRVGKFVLLKNKNNYNKIFNIHEFYHPDFGIIEGNFSEIGHKYKHIFGKDIHLRDLVSGKVKTIHGWVLAENKDAYENLINRSKKFTLTHLEYGTKTLTTSEFKKEYGLSRSSVHKVINRTQISTKDWHLPENSNTYKPSINIVTIVHPDLGTISLSRKEFREKFNDKNSQILSHLLKGRLKTYKGWGLI